MVEIPPAPRRAFLRAGAAMVAGGAAWVVGASELAAAPTSGVGTLTWFGQSCFLLETARGTKVLMDPLAKGLGFELPTGLKADLVTISHEHPDHANLGLLTSRPRVLRGLTNDKKGWLKIEERFRDVSIRSIGVYHDEKRGGHRGLDTIFVFEVGGMRIAHLGDIGHILTDEQRGDIGALDVVLLPVGGVSTIDAEQATLVMQQLRPRLMAVPMHYRPSVPPPPEPPKMQKLPGAGVLPAGTRPEPRRDGGKGPRGKAARTPAPPPPPPAPTERPLATVDEFLADKTNVRKVDGPTLTLSPVKPRPGIEIVVLTPVLAT